MIITSTVISTALSSLSLVYQAYVKVKTNKARCKKLVERCHTVVDRLQATIADIHDEVLEDRISYLELVFQRAATTIREVGQQGIIASILNTEENALKIDDCQHELSELVSLLNLQQVIDIGKWQSEHEEARVRDHKAALDVSRRLEEGNIAILKELSFHGDNLADVTRMVRYLSLNLGSNGNMANLQRPSADASDVLLPSAPTRRSKVPNKDYLSLKASSLEQSCTPAERCLSKKTTLHSTIDSVMPGQKPFQVHENGMDIPPPAYAQLPDGSSHCGIGGDHHGRQMTVQLWTLPTHVKPYKLISLDEFVPLDRRHLDLLKSKIHLISDTIQPLLRGSDVTSDPHNVLMLCPDDFPPHLVHVKTDHSGYSNYIPGFLLPSSEPQILMAVQHRRRTHWMLMPYSSDLRIGEAKHQIEKYFSPAIVVSCRNASTSHHLNDRRRFIDCGIRPYEHCVTITLGKKMT